MFSFGHVRRALLALAVGGFAIGTGEFVMLGLLPQVASDLAVSIPHAGQLVAAYALGVVVGAPVLTAFTVRGRRKRVLIALMVAFALGNVASALAPTFELALAARFLTGLPHGAFFGVASVAAAGMVPSSRKTSAMSVVFAGLTIANIVGVPATTLLGQHTSWRLVYAMVGVIALLCAALVVVFVPESSGSESGLRRELAAFTRPQVWITLLVTIFGGGGLFATFSYIAPMMTEVAGYAEGSITYLLVLFGLGMTVGNLVGAKLADRSLMRTLIGALVLEALVAGVFVFGAHDKIASAVLIFLFPATSLAVLPALQSRIITLAGGAPNLAAASIQAAFNIANSIGAFLGGAAISAGYGYASPNWVAALLIVVGIGFAVASVGLDRHTRGRPAPAEAQAPEAELPQPDYV
ncbi:MFS transporter [Jatrophihabitans sp. YIM 134969]